MHSQNVSKQIQTRAKCKTNPNKSTPRTCRLVSFPENSQINTPLTTPKTSKPRQKYSICSTGWTLKRVNGVKTVALWWVRWKRQSMSNRCMQKCRRNLLKSSTTKNTVLKSKAIKSQFMAISGASPKLSWRNEPTKIVRARWLPNRGMSNRIFVALLKNSKK